MNGQEERQIKDDLYEHFAQIGKAFGSARRLELIDLLSQSEYTVERLAEETDMSVANTSQHLKTLRAAMLVEVRREGVIAYYSLRDRTVYETWHHMRRLGEACSAEIERLAQRLIGQLQTQSTLSFKELDSTLDSDKQIILDVRPKREFRAGHILGAISIPSDELQKRVDEIDITKDIVVYCRGPYSSLSDRVVQWLQDNDYNARRLEQGFPEWRSAGFPIEEGTMELRPAG